MIVGGALQHSSYFMAHELWGCTWKQPMYMGNCGNRFGVCGLSARATAVMLSLCQIVYVVHRYMPQQAPESRHVCFWSDSYQI